MRLDLGAAWASMLASPLFGIALTLAAYQTARLIWRRSGGHHLVNPVLVGMLLIIGVLVVGRIDYSAYANGARYISLLLGPATVALALPLHRYASTIGRAALPVAACVLVGGVTGIVTAIAIPQAFGGSDSLALSMATKSVTTPIAIALAQTNGGVPELAAAFTILTGVVGATVGPALLDLLRVRDQRIRGLAMGVSSHGIGTARALQDNPVAGAYSGLAMAVNGLATTLLLPLLLVNAAGVLHLGR